MPNAVPPRATRREWLGLAVLALPCLLATMDLSILNLALPALTAELHPSPAQLLWIVDSYGFFIAGALLTMGTLGDRLGRRRVLLTGAVAFGLASILAAFATTAPMLIVARALLGLAGATLAPSTLSLLRNMFLSPQERTFAISIWITSFSVGGAIGPLVGGVLLQYFWWGSVFLVAVPVMVLLLIAGPRLLPEFRDPSAGRVDLLSAGLPLAAILSGTYGLKRLAEGAAPGVPSAAIVVGIALGVAFVRRQAKLADPLVDLRLFRNVSFSVPLVTKFFTFFAVFGMFVYTGQYLQLVLGLSPMHAGLWTIPSSIGFIVAPTLVTYLARRVRPAFVLGGGLVLAAVGFLLLAVVAKETSLWPIVVGSVIFAFGMTPVPTLCTNLIIHAAPAERAGVAAALSETCVELGGAMGVAVLGSIGTALYRFRVAELVAPTLPADMVDAIRDTLGGAVAIARTLPEPVASAILGPTRAAYGEALALAAIVSAGICLLLAVGIAVALGNKSGSPFGGAALRDLEGQTEG